MIRVLVNGVDGQMGRSVVQVAKTMEGLEVVAGVDKRVPEDFPFPVYSNIADCNLPVDVIIDFSRPRRWNPSWPMRSTTTPASWWRPRA